MSSQLTHHGDLEYDDCNFYDVAEEFIMGEANEPGDHDIAEAPQGSSSDILSSQEEEDGDPKNLVEEMKEASTSSQNSQAQKQQKPPSVDKLYSDPHVKEQVGKIMEEDIEHPTAEHEGNALQEADDAVNSLSINSIDSTVEESQGTMRPFLRSQEKQQQDDPNSLIKEMGAPVASQNPPDQQKQQSSLVELQFSDYPPLKEEEARKLMAEDPLKHQTVKHDEKAPEETGQTANSNSFNSIETAHSEENSVEKVCPPNSREIDGNDDKRDIDSGHHNYPKLFICKAKTLLSVITSAFALMVVMKLLHRS